MEPKYQFVFFLVALVCFVASAIFDLDKRQLKSVASLNMVSLGLAFFDFVFLWNAYKAI
jgi:hypothetical protein